MVPEDPARRGHPAETDRAPLTRMADASGLDRLCRTLQGLGVRHVFGLPGTQNAEFFSLLPDYGIRPIVPTNETSASFMANGYARISGHVAVLATIPGPGFTYAFPGLAEARLDSAPLLLLVATPSTRGGQRFQHQRINQTGMAEPLMKEIIEISAPAEISSGVRRGYATALSGEPGPVMIHLRPEALGADAGDEEAWNGEDGESGGQGREHRSHVEWAQALLDRVASARHPLVFAGAGAMSSADSVQDLVERWNVPFLTTVSGRGILPEDHPNALGFDPDRGHLDELNGLLEECDLVLALGCKLSHNGTAGFNIRLSSEKLVHVNTDAEALGPNYPASLAVHGSVDEALRVISNSSGVGPSAWTDAVLARWKSRIGAAAPTRREPAFRGVDDRTPQAFFEALRAALPREGIVVTDAGLHQVLTRRYFPVLSAGGLLTPTDFQSMGFGLPAAIGAKLAAPRRPVVAILGDGGFLFSAMDLLCAVRDEVSIAVVVFNDGFLNLIRLQQLAGHGRTAGVKLMTPRLDTLARALHVEHHLVDGDPEVTLREALKTPGVSLVEVLVGDSRGIRGLKVRGTLRYAARRTLGQRMITRLKALKALFGGAP